MSDQDLYLDWDVIERISPFENDKELAKAIGVHYNTISRLRKGEGKINHVVEIAKALDVNPLDLLSTRGFAPPKEFALVFHLN